MKIVIGLDNTITVPGDGVSYEDLLPARDVATKLRECSAGAFSIVIHTLRNMRPHTGKLAEDDQFLTDNLLSGGPTALGVLQVRR